MMKFKTEITGREKNVPIHTIEHDKQFHKNLQTNNRKVNRKTQTDIACQWTITTDHYIFLVSQVHQIKVKRLIKKQTTF